MTAPPPPDNPSVSDDADGNDPLGTDHRRAQRAWRIAGLGSLVIGTGLALAVGLLGGTGQAGMAVFLLFAAASCTVGALYATVTLVADDLRGRSTSRRRPIAALVLFVLAALLMAMVAGIGG